jgi:hypothetical protein
LGLAVKKEKKREGREVVTGASSMKSIDESEKQEEILHI